MEVWPRSSATDRKDTPRIITQDAKVTEGEQQQQAFGTRLIELVEQVGPFDRSRATDEPVAEIVQTGRRAANHVSVTPVRRRYRRGDTPKRATNARDRWL